MQYQHPYRILRFHLWIHPDKDNLEALANGRLIIHTRHYILLWMVGQGIWQN